MSSCHRLFFFFQQYGNSCTLNQLHRITQQCWQLQWKKIQLPVLSHILFLLDYGKTWPKMEPSSKVDVLPYFPITLNFFFQIFWKLFLIYSWGTYFSQNCFEIKKKFSEIHIVCRLCFLNVSLSIKLPQDLSKSLWKIKFWNIFLSKMPIENQKY